jgi:hypothetical protein
MQQGPAEPCLIIQFGRIVFDQLAIACGGIGKIAQIVVSGRKTRPNRGVLTIICQGLSAGGFERPPFLRYEEYQGESDLGLDTIALS